MFQDWQQQNKQLQNKEEFFELLKNLQKSRDLFRRLVDVCPYGTALTDFSGNIIVGNFALAKFLDVPISSLIKLNLKKIFKLPDSIFLLLSKEKVLSFCVLGKKVCEITLYFCKSDNAANLDNQKIEIYWHIKDIQEFVALQRHYRELVESLPVGVFEATGEGKILYLNTTGKKLLG